jgi:hypothetical protein
MLRIPRKHLEEDVTKKANSSNAIDEAFGRDLFKLFLQRPECIKTGILLNPPLIIVTPIMNLLPIMVILLVNALHIQLSKYHHNEDPILHIQQLVKVCVTNRKKNNDHKLQYFPNSLKGRIVD